MSGQWNCGKQVPYCKRAPGSDPMLILAHLALTSSDALKAKPLIPNRAISFENAPCCERKAHQFSFYNVFKADVKTSQHLPDSWIRIYCFRMCICYAPNKEKISFLFAFSRISSFLTPPKTCWQVYCRL